ncbi:Predicted DNA binding protein, contains HTH domain [Natronoarchaeum philippinense]|uniref:Predicted DNA binding protein, contains HTH domain n=1 Tax=Natronoarchaeum philippinense TaxID=558529 RepID=A0A285P5A7_NATPI|nr:helix-turn-helix domain-containing protein [Natronoarchaeum philippinense]SNZ16900.1 Predicted DNA binding protein, contains HTH domain [Natronoarchaeum philippinense]
MKRIRFSVDYPAELVHPLHRQIVEATPITRAELLTWSPTADATTLLWCDGDRDATERVIEGIDSLLARSFVEDTDGTYAFLRQADYEFPQAVLDLVAGANVIFLPPVVFLDTGAVRFEAVGETAALSAFHEELSAVGTPTIERVRPFERTPSPSRLTDRQREALDAAVSVGYYRVPREGTISDIAATIDCSTSTAGELVRKAESAVLTHFVETR